MSEMEEIESRLRRLVEQLPARVMAMDRGLRVVWDSGAAYPERETTVGTTVEEEFAGSPDLERVLDCCNRALAGETCRLEVDDGTTGAELRFAPFRDPTGKITGIIGTAVDITERRRAQEALLKAGEHLRTVLDTLPVGAVVMDRDGNVTFTNAEQARIWGQIVVSGDERWTKGEAYWHHSGARVEPTDWASRRALAKGETSLGELIDIENFDGKRRVIENSAAPIRDASGAIVGAVVVNKEVTDRVWAEEELGRRASQLQTLSRQLIQAQEAERRSLSNELHDDLGQMLFALKLNLERNGGGDTESIALVDGAIARMRDLVQSLRPPMLDELGLEAALRWHVEREATRAGVSFCLRLDHLRERPPLTVEITCFRIAQEALSNAIRHAHARALTVELSEDGDTLILVVHDDGQGFDVPSARSRATTGESQGLLSMQERVALVGGELQIDSRPTCGTSVTARLPLRQQG